MADQSAHIYQAKHNEKCAIDLLQKPLFRDWVITIAFYSAVHFAEASFIGNADIQSFQRSGHYDDESRHKFRSDVIRKFANSGWKSYSKLYFASLHVRYLTKSIATTSRHPANEYYSQVDAEMMVTRHLETVKAELQKAFKVPLS